MEEKGIRNEEVGGGVREGGELEPNIELSFRSTYKQDTAVLARKRSPKLYRELLRAAKLKFSHRPTGFLFRVPSRSLVTDSDSPFADARRTVSRESRVLDSIIQTRPPLA
ncbi:hypothetical protein V1477_013583 [Vespula maculifrons]|uniref:Uncharacterized protein n=1 Tax=Vespula maculifrons TaxID=7453 RepID=A0ABD2BQ98_VESMC